MVRLKCAYSEVKRPCESRSWSEERQIVFANTHHHLVLGHPAVGGEILQHRHQELQASVPVTEQQHHSNQVDDSHHCAGQVIGHMKNLNRDRSRDRTCWTQAVTHWSMNVTDIWNRAEYHRLPYNVTHVKHGNAALNI